MDVIQKLFATNKPAATFILAGLALLAASSIAVTWIGQNPNALFLAGYILGFAFLVTMATYIVRNPGTRAVIGWVLTAFFVFFLIGLVDSALGFTGRLPTPACYIRIFWEHPKTCEDRLFPPIPIATNDSSTPTASGGQERIWLAQNTSVPSRTEPYLTGPIYLQFGAEVERDAAIALASELSLYGWPVEGGDKGGEMVKSVPELNEVRFFDPAAEAEAIALAQTLKAAHPHLEIVVRDFSRSGLIAPAGLLEIWLSSQPF
jgi:hypothetical protein